MGWDLIRIQTAINKAQITRDIGTYKMLLNPANREVAAAKFMNDECLHRRQAALRITELSIERTNHAIEQLDEGYDCGLIEASREANHELMAALEPNFDVVLARETASLMPVIYWLDSEVNIDDLCGQILDMNGITEHESMILAALNSVDPVPQELAIPD
jgi:hypothetical protein